MTSHSQPPTSRPDSAPPQSFRLQRANFSVSTLEVLRGAAGSEPVIPRANFDADSLRPPQLAANPDAPVYLRTSQPVVDPRDRWAFLTAFAGWATWLLTWYCYSQARPIEFKLDKMFGVVRGRGWDTSMLVAGVFIALLAMLLAALSLVLSYSRTGGGKTKHPWGAFALVALSIVSLLVLVFPLRGA